MRVGATMKVSEHEAFRSLALIGTPGSGKTTLLQHLTFIHVVQHNSRPQVPMPPVILASSRT